MPRNEAPIEVAIPENLWPKLARETFTLQTVFAQDDHRRPKTQLTRLANTCSQALDKFLADLFPDLNTSPKVSKPKLLAGPVKGSYFGVKIKGVCSELQLAKLLSLTGETGFLELGKLGSCSDSLRMLFTPRPSAKQPAQPAATASRVYQLRLDNLPEGMSDLLLKDVDAVFSPAGFQVLSVHPVYRSNSRGRPAADSMVVVVRTAVPLAGRRVLHISGFPGRTGKVRSHFTVYKYPALPPWAVVYPQAPAATADAAAATVSATATKPAAAVPKTAARPAAAPAAAAPSAAVRTSAAPASAVPAAATVQPVRAQPAPTNTSAAATVTAAAKPHAAAPMHAHASAAQPAATPTAPASAPVPMDTLPAVAPSATQSLKRAAQQQQPDDSQQPTAPAASVSPRAASAGAVLPHGPSLSPRAQASHSAPSPQAAAASAASLAAPAPAVAVAMPASASSAAVAKPKGFLGDRGGSAFTFKFAAPRATKHPRPPQPAPSGVALEDIGAAPTKRQELAPAAQSAPSAAAGDAMLEH